MILASEPEGDDAAYRHIVPLPIVASPIGADYRGLRSLMTPMELSPQGRKPLRLMRAAYRQSLSMLRYRQSRLLRCLGCKSYGIAGKQGVAKIGDGEILSAVPVQVANGDGGRINPGRKIRD
jgi:hypothetical protein